MRNPLKTVAEGTESFFEKEPKPPKADVNEKVFGVILKTVAEISVLLSRPEILKNCPDAVERIFTMTEEQLKHRREMESKLAASDIDNARCGLNYGLIIGLSAIIGSTIIALKGQPIVGTILGGLIVSLVAKFVYGTRHTRKERNNSSEE